MKILKAGNWEQTAWQVLERNILTAASAGSLWPGQKKRVRIFPGKYGSIPSLGRFVK